MKTYKHLFFDLDHTLWDWDANASETLIELYHRYDLGKYGVLNADLFRDVFFHENTILWKELDAGRIDKFYLRNHRFRIVMEAVNANMKSIKEDLLVDINANFLKECSQKKRVIEGAFEVLDYCKDKFDLHIITNGFEEVQSIKMEYSGLDKYFDKIITSEKAGHKKPNAGIYQYAIKHTGAVLEDSLMIGDNLMTDIKGARDYGMDQVYYNPLGQAYSDDVTLEITELRQIIPFLEG
ncbi:YjjG family noncanonical pyrimidine nucleotidase [Reichenbachiella carrageenanivorans]|uniref:YjjG family noncanonical pyrimidine nucleotidase n=1 Tax=Reichenbachiella carrageenanivorans TaxID=2979869 RepID=A0ABY6D9Y9_9BACT|nr:YjjG family noncanonical pyrimidine nucleotidase [Reichenbachiella carrageenanivorans]UXX80690.1 YjjG family noncanonical pyrimidine nucleotidase [Reichenbachiella carrageenanivorans]